MKARTTVVGVAVLGMALAACGEPKEVSGLRDDIKTTKAIKAVPELSHMVTKTRTKYKRTCTSYKNGSCKSYSNLPNGTETYQEKVIDRYYKPGKAKQYCVELDHVKDGDSYRDDVWFNVSSSEYYSAAGKNEGEKISKMKYNHEGC